MKSKNILITNLILLALAFAVSFSLCACSSDTEESSFDTSETSDKTVALTLDVAKELVEKDKKIIGIFACNSLSSSETSVGYVPLAENHEFRDFEKIRELLASTYASDSGELDSFLAYPIETLPSVCDKDGVTNVFYHKGSRFDDFAVSDSLSVETSPEDGKSLIKARTVSGREVTFEAVYENEKWLLKNSLLSLIPVDNSCDKEFPLSDSGSLSEFSGNVLVINFFISDVNYKFTEEEEQSFASRVSTAVDHLASEAEKLGGEVNVTYENAYFTHVGNIGNGDLAFDIVFSETGFGTLRKFAEKNYDLSQYDNYFFAVCFNKECENLYKANDGTDMTEVYYGERLFVGSNTTEEDIARMVLKLAGAYDYRSGVCDEYTESLYKAYFPNDVFSEGALDKSTVSPVTAYSCGIVKELPELYQIFIYTQDNQEQSEEQ